jgi:hypothetical protein
MEPNESGTAGGAQAEPPQRQVFRGAFLIVVGIALGFVAERNKPADGFRAVTEGAHGLSHTVYDLLRVGIWAMWIFGVLLIIMGLIQFRAHTRRDALGRRPADS